jgi:hypothetical protein
MKTHAWQRVICIIAASVVLLGMPVLGLAQVTDSDSDGIDDSLEQTGGAGISFGGFTYRNCADVNPTGTTIVNRHTCLSPTSKDIFIYLVTATSGGGFLATNGLITMSTPVNATQCATTASTSCTGLFGFITAPNTATTTGEVDGLGVGVHVAVVTTAPTTTTRAVGGSFGQLAVAMTVDESASAFAFGSTVQGTPSQTGNSTIWPVYIKNFVDQNITGGIDTPSIWKPYIQNVGSHELSHAAALTAAYNSKLGQYHYAAGSGTVMDDHVICSSKTHTCNIYNDYASGDKPCLLALVSPTTNPLQCTALSPVIF